MRLARHHRVALAFPILVVCMFAAWHVDMVAVRSDSMLPAISSGQRVLVIRPIRVRGKELFPSILRRGQIVVIEAPTESGKAIKRIIGLPGDKVRIRSGEVFINSKASQEPYALHGDELLESQDTWPPSFHDTPLDSYTVPSGRLFVLGDNRPISADSRLWGSLSLDAIYGRVALVLP